MARCIIRSPSTSEGASGEYEDIPGFCKSATLDDIRKHGHVLTPGRYVGAEAQEDDGEPFEEKMKRLTATLREQQAEAAKLDDDHCRQSEGAWVMVAGNGLECRLVSVCFCQIGGHDSRDRSDADCGVDRSMGRCQEPRDVVFDHDA